DIGATRKRIYDFTGQRIFKNRVDGKVTTPRCLLKTHRRIAFDDESFVSAAGFALASREGNVERRAEFVNREGFADHIHLAKAIEQRSQIGRLDAVDFQVPILRLALHQQVAHAAADEQSSAI